MNYINISKCSKLWRKRYCKDDNQQKSIVCFGRGTFNSSINIYLKSDHIDNNSNNNAFVTVLGLFHEKLNSQFATNSISKSFILLCCVVLFLQYL